MTEQPPASTATLNPRTQGEVEVAIKAWKDDAFKQALLANPKTTLEQEFQMEFPADLSVRVVEAQPDHFYLRLPMKPEGADALSIEELTQSLSQTEGEAIAPLIAKAWKDETFKQALLSDPKAILIQDLGAELPDGLAVDVLEEDAHTLMMVLPMKPDSLEGELSDDDLESIAGGTITSVLSTIGKAVFPWVVREGTASAVNAGARAVASVAASTALAAGGTAATVIQLNNKPADTSSRTSSFW